jgi:hypothetical protein
MTEPEAGSPLVFSNSAWLTFVGAACSGNSGSKPLVAGKRLFALRQSHRKLQVVMMRIAPRKGGSF